MARPVRVYIDSSIFGGVCDEEFEVASKAFLAKISLPTYRPVVSATVLREIAAAPADVQNAFRSYLPLCDTVEVSDDVLALARAYVSLGVVSENWFDDAVHVATATVAECSLIVSWNFRHIVHFQKIPRYNAANVLMGYGPIAIHSPREVLADEEE